MSRRPSDRSTVRVEWAKTKPQVGADGSTPMSNDTNAQAPSLPYSRPRLTLTRLQSLALQLDSVELEVIASLRKVRMASGDQLRRLHFGSGQAAERRARRVLSRLTDLAVVSRLDRTIGGRRAGSKGHIYGLGLETIGLCRPLGTNTSVGSFLNGKHF